MWSPDQFLARLETFDTTDHLAGITHTWQGDLSVEQLFAMVGIPDQWALTHKQNKYGKLNLCNTKVYRLRRSRCKLTSKKTIAHDDITLWAMAFKILMVSLTFNSTFFITHFRENCSKQNMKNTFEENDFFLWKFSVNRKENELHRKYKVFGGLRKKLRLCQF